MRNSAVMLAAASVGMAVGAIGSQAIVPAKPTVLRTELVNADLAACAGKEVRMYTTELMPGVITPRHRHPGQYFSYVLEGEGVLEEDGKSPLTLGPGVAYHIDALPGQPESWHTVWNTGSTQRLRTVVVLIADKGKPTTLFEK